MQLEVVPLLFITFLPVCTPQAVLRGRCCYFPDGFRGGAVSGVEMRIYRRKPPLPIGSRFEKEKAPRQKGAPSLFKAFLTPS